MPLGLSPAFAFDAKNRAAQKVAQAQAARMITRVSKETQKAIRLLIVSSIRDGIPPVTIARQMRKMLGMNLRQAVATNNYRKLIAKGGFTKLHTEALTGKFVQKKIRERAINIARTETMTALNRGKVLSWEQGMVDGTIDKSLKVEILATGDERTCPICDFRNGSIVSVKDHANQPSFHNMCRCTVMLVEKQRRQRFVPRTVPNISRTPTFVSPNTGLRTSEDQLKAWRTFQAREEALRLQNIEAVRPEALRGLFDADFAKLTIDQRNILKVYDTMLSSLDDMARKFDDIGFKIPKTQNGKSIRFNVQPDKRPSVYASADVSGSPDIFINSNYSAWRSRMGIRKSMQNDFKTGWHPGGEAADILTHEVGHILNFRSGSKIGQNFGEHFQWGRSYEAGSSWSGFLKRFQPRLKRQGWDFKNFPSSAKKIAREVSRYAETMPVEFVAETFNGLVNGNIYSDRVMKLYELLGGHPVKIVKKVVKPLPKPKKFVKSKKKISVGELDDVGLAEMKALEQRVIAGEVSIEEAVLEADRIFNIKKPSSRRFFKLGSDVALKTKRIVPQPFDDVLKKPTPKPKVQPKVQPKEFKSPTKEIQPTSTFIKEEAVALDDYTANIGINDGLRTGDLTAAEKLTAKKLDDMLARSFVDEDVLLWRGIPKRIDPGDVGVFEIGDFKVGQVIQDSGFMSTTSSRKWAKEFIEDLFDESLLIKVKVPKGTSMIDVNTAMKWSNAQQWKSGGPMNFRLWQQKEFILPRNLRLVVTKVDDIAGIIELEVVESAAGRTVSSISAPTKLKKISVGDLSKLDIKDMITLEKRLTSGVSTFEQVVKEAVFRFDLKSASARRFFKIGSEKALGKVTKAVAKKITKTITKKVTKVPKKVTKTTVKKAPKKVAVDTEAVGKLKGEFTSNEIKVFVELEKVDPGIVKNLMRISDEAFPRDVNKMLARAKKMKLIGSDGVSTEFAKDFFVGGNFSGSRTPMIRRIEEVLKRQVGKQVSSVQSSNVQLRKLVKGKRVTITKAEEDRVVRLFRQGVPKEEIAEELGFLVEKGRGILRTLGDKFRLKHDIRLVDDILTTNKVKLPSINKRGIIPDEKYEAFSTTHKPRISITPEHEKAMSSYIWKGDRDINGVLRFGKVTGRKGGLSLKDTKKLIRSLDDLFKNAAVTTEDIVVHRVSGTKFSPDVGKTFTDKGFVSTAAGKNPPTGILEAGKIAEEFVITIPKGTPIVTVESVLIGEIQELEILLGRGTTFRVTKKAGKKTFLKVVKR